MMNYSPRTRAHNRQTGFTMVELLVGIVLGLVLVGVASSVFVAARHSFMVQDNASHMQESSRAILEDITREIRKAGSFGCYRWKDTNSRMLVTATQPTGAASTFPIPTINANVDGSILGGPVSGLAVPVSSGITPVPGSDFISLMYGQPVATLTVGAKGNGLPASSGAAYPLNKPITVAAGQPMAIADCSSLTIFRVDNTGSTNLLGHVINGGNNIMPADNVGSDPMLTGNMYRGGSMVMWLELPSFFIGTDANGLISLYRWDTSNGGGIQPMVPNVEQMRVVFGVDTANAPGHLEQANAWMSGTAVTSGNLWPNVVSAAVHLVLRSDDEGGAGVSPKTFTWDGAHNVFVATGSVSDRFIRQVIVINAALRTRLPLR